MSVPHAKIWNDHVTDYSEKFKDVLVTIPAKHFITMEKPDADQFLGQFVPIKRDGQGRDLNPKMLRLEVVSVDEARDALKYQCMACNRQHTTEKDLQSHIEANHVEQMVDEKAKDEIKKKAK